MTTARLSLLFLYRRIFNLRLFWFRLAWWCCIVIVSLYCITLVVDDVVQCKTTPLHAGTTDLKLCWHRELQAAIMGYLNAAIDLTILVLPIRMVWILQMERRQKMAIGGVFGLGLMYVLATASLSVNP